MRLNGQITATLLAVALISVGCSESRGTPEEKVQSKPSARATPVSTIAKSDTKPTGHQGFDTLVSEPVGPASFGDGEAAYQDRNYAEAMKVFERYASENPNNVWGHYMLGLSAWKSGDLEKAETAFEGAIRIDPHHFKSLVNMARVLIEQARFDDALDNLTRAADIDPNSADVHRVLARTYAAQGKIEAAANTYRRAISLDDMDAWSLNNLGFLLLEQGRPEEAVPLLARAVELGKDAPVFHNNLGMALEHTGRFAAAAAQYGSALDADPEYEKAQQNLARVEVVKVDFEEPFDLKAAASSVIEQPQIPSEESQALVVEPTIEP